MLPQLSSNHSETELPGCSCCILVRSDGSNPLLDYPLEEYGGESIRLGFEKEKKSCKIFLFCFLLNNIQRKCHECHVPTVNASLIRQCLHFARIFVGRFVNLNVEKKNLYGEWEFLNVFNSYSDACSKRDFFLHVCFFILKTIFFVISTLQVAWW